MNLQAFWRTPLFWILFTLLSCAGIGISFQYFTRAIPIANVTITMDRSQALEQARIRAQEQSLSPDDYQQAISFTTDTTTKTYVELEAGGTPAFNEMISGTLYAPYTWQVRHFKEFEKHETVLRFTPDGTPYGFKETLAETTPGANLPAQQARVIAEETAQTAWNVPLQEFALLESSQEEKPSKRIDHTFVYERPKTTIGDARYRVRLVVSGDKLSEVTYFMKIPQEFLLKYQHMRSFNTMLAGIATILMFLLYFVGCCLFGLFLLVNKEWIRWRTAFTWGAFLATLQALVTLNQIPLLFMGYDTALGTRVFLARIILNACIGLVSTTIFYTLIIGAAESLTRSAFGDQPQIWSVWAGANAASLQIAGRTIGGYLLAPIHLAYVILFYMLTSKFLGWWNPSETLIDPNILASYMPWFSSLAQALNAGFWEECMFRAIPLATAALLGRKLNREKLFIGSAFILQALIFSAAHANYPTQPFYGRLVELMFPSCLFATAYLLFGLLPAIISHFVYDAILMSLPLFITQTPHAWLYQGLVVFCITIPLWIVMVTRLRTGRFAELASTAYNAAWQPTAANREEESILEIEPLLTLQLPNLQFIVGALGIASCVVWLFTQQFNQDGQALHMNRATALKKTHHILQQNNIALSPAWQQLTRLRSTYQSPSTTGIQHSYVWQTAPHTWYDRYLDSYLLPAAWLIRTVTFEGSASERAEEYQHVFIDDGKLVRTMHSLPENRPGKQLTEEEARSRALEQIHTLFGLDKKQMSEISAVSEQRPERRDWTFTFADLVTERPETFDQQQLRITVIIAGDEITDAYRFVHVPEAWTRTYQNIQVMNSIVNSVCRFILFLLLGLGFLYALRKKKHHMIPHRLFANMFVASVAIYILYYLNALPLLVANFRPVEPFFNQMIMIGISTLVMLVLVCGFGSYMIALTLTWFTVPTQHSLTRVGLGISLGTLVASTTALFNYIKPSLDPLWASYDALNTYSPLVNVMSSALLMFVMQTTGIFATLIVLNTLRRRSLPILMGTFIGLGIMTTSLPSVEYLLFWLSSGTVFGLVYFALYYYFIRYDYALVPLIVGVMIGAQMLQQAVFNAYPNALTLNIYATCLIAVFAYGWYVFMIQASQQQLN